MRRKWMLGAAVAAGLFALGATPAHAQWWGAGKSDVGIFGAYLNSNDANNSNFSVPGVSNSKDNFGGGVKARLGWLDLRATYFSNVNTNRIGSFCSSPNCFTGNFKLRVIPLEVGVAIPFAVSEHWSPYVGAGGGYYLLRGNNSPDETVLGTSTRGNFKVDNEVGYYGVLGTDLALTNGWGLVGEVMYRHIRGTVRDRSGSLADGVSDRVNVQLGGVGANLGVVYRF